MGVLDLVRIKDIFLGLVPSPVLFFQTLWWVICLGSSFSALYVLRTMPRKYYQTLRYRWICLASVIICHICAYFVIKNIHRTYYAKEETWYDEEHPYWKLCEEEEKIRNAMRK